MLRAACSNGNAEAEKGLKAILRPSSRHQLDFQIRIGEISCLRQRGPTGTV